MADQPIIRANVERVTTVSPGFASFYVNDTQLQTSPWDVRFMFGLIQEVDQDKQIAKIERVVDVRMSLQHAKKISEVLREQIQQYESKIGFIALPPDEK